MIKYQDVFGDTIVELASKNNKIVVLTPAMLTGSSLNKMRHKFPERTFDVGIADKWVYLTTMLDLATEKLLDGLSVKI